jgi:hypothetical protein
MDFMIAGNEKGHQRKVVSLLLCFFIFYLSANFLAIQYDHYLRKVEEHALIFRGDVNGKFALMKQLFGKSTPDIIFIGNSVTILHVDTHFFHANKINSFNYATTGYFIAQYPQMVENAIKLKPKSIAFSLTVDDFYKPSNYYFTNYDHMSDITWHNFYYFAKSNGFSDLTFLIDYGFVYLKNFSFFTKCGHTITRGLKEKYARLKHRSKLIHMVFPHYRKRSLDQVSFACDFDRQGHPVPSGCYNGDAVMMGALSKDQFSPYKETIRLENKNYNFTVVNIFNSFFDEIRKAGIRPYLILIPSYKHYLVDQSLLKRSLHAEIIDLSDVPFSQSYFKDNVHFNREGRANYSKILVQKLKSSQFFN